MRPSLQLAWTLAFAVCLSFLHPATVLAGSVSEPKLFPERTLDEAEAAHQGYRTIDVDLGSPKLSFEALVREGMEANVLARADAIETPGRELLATIFAPEDRTAFAISVVGFSPGFAAQAPAAAEQLLFEGGYGLADAAHETLVSGQAFGLIREGGQPARAARTLCDARGSVVLCFVMEFDAEHETEAMAQAAAFAGSLTHRDGGENAFDPQALTDIALPLPDGGSLELTYPSAWAVADNAFARGESGALQMHHGPADDPYSALVLTVSAGQAPTSPDGLEAAATAMVERYVENNASVLANPKLASRTGVRSAEPDAPFRSFAFIADKANGSGQAQLRLTLMAFGGLRYAVLMVTNYSAETDDSGAFFVRWSATTAEDLAVESILRTRR